MVIVGYFDKITGDLLLVVQVYQYSTAIYIYRAPYHVFPAVNGESSGWVSVAFDPSYGSSHFNQDPCSFLVPNGDIWAR